LFLPRGKTRLISPRKGVDVKKTATKNGKINVTFELPPAVMAGKAVVLGDFNGWQDDGTPMKKRKNGGLSATVRLDPGRYRFRYLIDGERWENDWSADDYEPNAYGGDDSVVTV
jgi:1,4-alpha-glucan branching enzyme